MSARNSIFATAILLSLAAVGVSPAEDAFMTIHMDNQKSNSAVSANWRPLTTGSVSTGGAKPVTAEAIDLDPCAPGLMTIQGDTEYVTCEWAVAE